MDQGRSTCAVQFGIVGLVTAIIAGILYSFPFPSLLRSREDGCGLDTVDLRPANTNQIHQIFRHAHAVKVFSGRKSIELVLMCSVPQQPTTTCHSASAEYLSQSMEMKTKHGCTAVQMFLEGRMYRYTKLFALHAKFTSFAASYHLFGLANTQHVPKNMYQSKYVAGSIHVNALYISRNSLQGGTAQKLSTRRTLDLGMH